MAGYLAMLFLQLNPAVPLDASATLPLVATLLLSYGVHAAVLFYGVIVVWQLLGADVLSPGWVSLRVLVWLAGVASAAAAAMMWLNLQELHVSLDPSAARRMAEGAAAVSVASVVFFVMAVVRSSVGRKPGWITAGVFAATVTLSFALPLWLRGHGTVVRSGSHADAGPSFEAVSSAGRVIVLAVDGATLDYISPAAADGRLPNFGRLLDTGAVMHLATLRPTQPGPVWTAVATAKLPYKNGVRSAARYQFARNGAFFDLLPDYCFAHALVYFGLVSERPLTSASVAARPLWNILGGSGIQSIVVRWPLTYPAQPLHGVIVTDHLHLTPDSPLPVDDPQTTYPADVANALRLRPDPPAAAAAALVGPATTAIGSLATDRLYSDAFDAVSARSEARLLALRYQSLDVAGHYYLRQAMPRVFGDVSDEERRQYGRVLDQFYRYLDGEVGRVVEHMGPDDLLLVVSGFGMEPLTVPKRLLDRALGTGELSGTHERAPDGFLLAFGHPVRAGHFGRASVVDVVPTILYFFGLPIGRDMDGLARTDLFSRDFTEERPVTFIPSYEN